VSLNILTTQLTQATSKIVIIDADLMFIFYITSASTGIQNYTSLKINGQILK